MPRIRFIADPKLPRDLAHLGYVKGMEVELSEDQAGRWLRRGVADVVPAAVEAEPEPQSAALYEQARTESVATEDDIRALPDINDPPVHRPHHGRRR